ncbi:MAG: endonuclease [Bacteroidia bacterium]|nr:endonuclease [Bacteroidia bacterium]
MTKRLYLTTLWLLFGFLLSSNVFAQTPPTGLTGQALRDWIKQNFYDSFHTTLGYSTARMYMYNYIDNQNNTITDVYGGFVQPWTFGGTGTNPAPINAEHTIPQSFFGSADPMQSDIHHLFPSLDIWNSTRSNYPFADIADNVTTKWMRDDVSQTTIPTTLIEEYSEYANQQFEPREDHKGDCARAIFYFFTMYPTQAGAITSVADPNMLFQWHQQDPVSPKETARNAGVEMYQGNRNPYIDHPEWVADAWSMTSSAPSAPTNLAVSAGATSLTLSWTDAAGETGYEVYNSTDNVNFSLLTTLSSNAVSYTHTGLSVGTTYYYYLVAFNGTGSSPNSVTVSGTPTGGSGGGGNATDLILSEYIEGSSFNKALEVANFTGAPVNLAGYVLRKETNGGGVWGDDYALTGTLANGEVWVIAHSSADPTILAQADVSTGSAIVNFNGNDVVGLFKNGTLLDVIGNFGSSAVFAQDVTLVRKADIVSPNSTYTVAEWDSYPTNTFGNLGSHIFNGSAPEPPAAPTNLILLATTTDLNLSWDDVADEEGYLVFRSEDNVSFAQITSLAANENTFTDNTVQLLIPYYYYVVAYNAGGNSGNSNVVSGATESTGGNASDLLISEYIEGSSFNKALEIANFTGASVSLTGYVLRKETNGGGVWADDYALSGTLAHGAVWVIANNAADPVILAQADVSTGAAIVTFNGNDVVGLFKNGTLLDVVGNFGTVANFGADVTLVRKATVTNPSASYNTAEWDSYATNTFSNLGSHTVNGSAPNPPAAPANLTLTATVDDLSLTWDNVADEGGYLVFRSSDNVTFAQVADLGADVLAFTDNTMQLLTTYYYYVVAYNVGGNSGNSNVVSGQTETPPVVATDLFFSEYVEGTQNNHALEIANFTGAAVNLSAYSLKWQSNGGGNWRNTYTLSGTLADGEVFVVGHASASASITAVADLLIAGGVMNFAGNDPVGLFKNNVLIDIIGVFNGGSANFAANTTRVRKPEVLSPNTTYTVSEWNAYASNTFSFLGSHTFGTAKVVLFGDIMPVVNAWPNPFEDKLAVRISVSDRTLISADLYNLMGQKIQTLIPENEYEEGESEITIPTTALAPGMYLLTVVAGDEKQTIKVIKR